METRYMKMDNGVPSALSPKRVLVVDDNYANRLLACLMLETLGYTHASVDGGHEALENIAHNHYDIILMDVRMPEMDGLETTRRIRQFENEHSMPHVPIIAVTADAVRMLEDKCTQAGMDGFMTKPYSAADLAQKISSFVH